MSAFFSFVFLIALILLPFAIWKPKTFLKNPNASRKMAGLVFGSAIFASFIGVGLTADPSITKVESEPLDQTVKTESLEAEEIIQEATSSSTLVPIPTPIFTPTLIPTSKPTIIPTFTPKPTSIPTAAATSKPVVQQKIDSEPKNNAWGKSCSGVDYDCADFSSQSDAQAFFNGCGFTIENDPMKLDSIGLGDGIACESLP